MLFIPIPATLVSCGAVLKLASRTSCVDEDADIDGRGRAVGLLLWRSLPKPERSSLFAAAMEEMVIAGEAESLLLCPFPPFPGLGSPPSCAELTFLPDSGLEKLKLGITGKGEKL